MNFDPVCSEFLQNQPILSTQIIPELVDENPIQHVEPVINKTACKLPPPKITTAAPKQNITNGRFIGIKTEDFTTKTKMQIVRKLPANVIQINGETNHMATVNKPIVSESSVISPIVINKTTGSISGMQLNNILFIFHFSPDIYAIF